MPENQRLCCYCHQYKTWLWFGKRLKDGSKIYVDSESSRWAGKRCPDCERKRIRAALKCSLLEKELVFAELKNQGFEILSSSFPVKVSKDGQTMTAGIRYATTKEGQIFVEDSSINADFFVLLFQSARVVTKQSLQKLQASVTK